MVTRHDRDVLAYIKDDARKRGLGLREYCRTFGITYTSLRGDDLDLDAASREADLDALDIEDDGQEKLERQMLGGWDDSPFLDHLAYLREKKRGESVA